ncbi:MAG TPA: sigma-54 dependent transcriptional regulator [Acidobacteriota bacterium]
MILRVLVGVDSAPFRRRLLRILKDLGTDPLVAAGDGELWERLTREDLDLVLLDQKWLPEPAEKLIASIRTLPQQPEMIAFYGREEPELRARLLAAGCLAVLLQDLTSASLRDTLKTLLDSRRETATLRLRADRPEERYGLADLFHASPAMERLLAVARKVVRSDSALLILGETGVGKGRLARAIHQEGARAVGPFLAISCGALPESLLESELFGHEEGAFTGATRARRGYFELAHGGTIFLDEIGELPLHLQVKLLQVLEDHRLLRVGGERHIPVDVRIMAATHRDLEAELKAGRFRADLFYRLAVVTISIPPLRERHEDIPLLVQRYLELFRQRQGHKVAALTRAALRALEAYDWPGNVRELMNVMERAVLLCQGSEIDLADLPAAIGAGAAAVPERGAAAASSATSFAIAPAMLSKSLRQLRAELNAELERAYVAAQLEATRGQLGETARRCGLNPRSLYEMMKRHGLRKEAFKQVIQAPKPESSPRQRGRRR